MQCITVLPHSEFLFRRRFLFVFTRLRFGGEPFVFQIEYLIETGFPTK